MLGSAKAVASMVQTALAPPVETATIADSHWVAQTADHILSNMEANRSTWQMWHVRAEAQRQVRTVDLPAEHAAALVDLLVDEVLDRRSVALAAPHDGIEEPEVLRRVDGSSVYTVAGADLYTSQRILDAEARLVATAGRHDGASVEQTTVDLALLEMAANGTRTRCRAGGTGPPDVHLRGTSAARDRPRRRRENNSYARPHPGVDPRRRPGGRPRSVGRRGRRPRRAHRHPQ